MHGIIIRYDLIREKCMAYNEETQKFIGGICMSKIFTWVFGFVTGIIGGMFVMAACMVERPDDFIPILQRIKSNTNRK